MEYISQDFLPARPRSFLARRFRVTETADAVVALKNLDKSAACLGISLHISEEGHVDAVAFATPEDALYVELRRSSGSDIARKPKIPPLSTVPARTLVGFSMERIALHLHRDHSWPVCGVDLTTLLPKKRIYTPGDFLEEKSSQVVRKRDVDRLWYPDPEGSAMERTCLRAWITAVCAAACSDDITDALPADTANLGSPVLARLGGMVLWIERLEAKKSLVTENEFRSAKVGDGIIYLENARYKNRIRQSEQTSVIMHTKDGNRIEGQAVGVTGKTSQVRIVKGSYHGESLKTICVHGREEYTNAEVARSNFFLKLLQGVITLSGRPLIDHIYFHRPGTFAPKKRVQRGPVPPAFCNLNESQRLVASAMISTSELVVIAHGPPGTGKTSTIAAAVEYWSTESMHDTVWIIAQSNVGVKNIARSFMKKGIEDFMLIVSKEFHFEWHEHLYTSIEHKVIRSDDMCGHGFDAKRAFGGTRAVLCTLSMLSNPILELCGVFRVIPLQKLVVDEASQINIAEYMHVLHNSKYLQKLCLFGDPKQLPPYGKDQVRDLQSIFDVPHLKSSAYFLNTQYRMPLPLGGFISHEVYNSKLQSVHSTTTTSCVKFIDVSKGVEKNQGKSWINVEEVNMVVTLVRDYYRHKDFCVITPYDAQRAEIQKALERANLRNDCVFNVDSFQGHEAPYVILSIVRTDRVGFLAAQDRSNVMLSRCQAGMVIVTNKYFVRSSARKTLLGKLAAEWEGQDATTWVDWTRVIDKTASLPGLIRTPSHSKPIPLSITAAPRSASGRSREHAPSLTSLTTQLGQMKLAPAMKRATPSQRRDEAFPEIGQAFPAKPVALKGVWKRGCQAVKSC